MFDLSAPEGYLGTDAISLGDIISSPDVALKQMSYNFSQNWLQMAVAGFSVGFTTRMAKRLLRKQIANINRNVAKPLFGGDFKL